MTVKIEDMFGNAAYEFIDLIKADPLVSESSPSMDVDKDKFRSIQRSEKITKRAQDTGDEATAEVAKSKMSTKAKVQLPNIRQEERLVDKILGELDENRFASHGGKETDAGYAYAKPFNGGNKKGVYTLKGKDGKPLFDKKEKSNESIEIDEKLGTQYKDKTKLGQSSERKTLGRRSSTKDGSKPTGYESPKEFRDKSMPLRKHRERFGDLAKEEVTIDERVRLEADNGNLLMVVAAWKGRSYQMTMFFPQPTMPTREEVESEIQKVYPGSRLMSYRITKSGVGQPIMQVVNSHSKNYLLNNGNIGEEKQNEDWQKVNKGDKTDGMSKKAVAAYRSENPGSKLKTAVTGKVKKGSKDAKRRKSFCARSKGQQDMHNIDCSKTPDKPVCKARRRWKC